MNDGWIVVVDDNPIDLRLVQVLLAAAGYEVRAARDSKAVDQQLTVFSPRLMLLGFQLPTPRCIEWVERLKAAPETRHIAVIAMVPHSLAGARRAALAAGCSDCVSKPLDTVTLLETVARRLPKRALHR